jgi:hypothetical protein
MNWDLWLKCYDHNAWDYEPYWTKFMRHCWDNKLNRLTELQKWHATYELYISEEVIKFKDKNALTFFLLAWG